MHAGRPGPLCTDWVRVFLEFGFSSSPSFEVYALFIATFDISSFTWPEMKDNMADKHAR